MADQVRKFVIQQHSLPAEVHWDLMLEKPDVLTTYRLDKPPLKLLTESAKTEKIFDHPKKFLTYQGSVNKGKGQVEIVESGTYEIITDHNDKIELSLRGQILNGNFTLSHIDGVHWIFNWEQSNG